MIVYFAGSRYNGRAGTDRHMADELSAIQPVLFVEPPVSVLTPLLNRGFAESLRGPALRQVGPNLWRLVPRVLPGAHRPGMHRVTAALLRRKARRAAATLGRPVSSVVVTGYADLLDAVPGARSLFYATDDLVAGAELIQLPVRRLRAAEARSLACADEVAVVSPALRERFRGLGREAAFVPNGCAPQAYEGVDSAPWPADVPVFDRPAAGFVGIINGRIELALLEAVADAGHPLLLVGPHGSSCDPVRFRALTARENVCWVGIKPFAELPSYLRVIAVGLTPYVVDDFNRASFPLKTLEYLAAGRGVVSTCLPATEWLRSAEEGAALIHVESSPAGFVRAVSAELSVERTPALDARRRRFAGQHTWARRARTLAGLLGIDPATGAAAGQEQEAGHP
jgi:teichuronic acid biosynthesis glycosyltransferase TuaH